MRVLNSEVKILKSAKKNIQIVCFGKKIKSMYNMIINITPKKYNSSNTYNS